MFNATDRTIIETFVERLNEGWENGRLWCQQTKLAKQLDVAQTYVSKRFRRLVQLGILAVTMRWIAPSNGQPGLCQRYQLNLDAIAKACPWLAHLLPQPPQAQEDIPDSCEQGAMEEPLPGEGEALSSGAPSSSLGKPLSFFHRTFTPKTIGRYLAALGGDDDPFGIRNRRERFDIELTSGGQLGRLLMKINSATSQNRS